VRTSSQVENCNYAVTLGRAMDFHLVNMAGLDLVDGSTKLLLGYMWQLMRYHTLKQLSVLAFDGFAADEGEVLSWANSQVRCTCNRSPPKNPSFYSAPYPPPCRSSLLSSILASLLRLL
jgi:hypothetical protein